ncbi:hypothetical protein [Streptomyces sp. NPDC015350]|uniref:hypothetical protein n=1 Tax=Streptomyces sp. NPDC015350 TaxID=3364955 RepID=UPI00370349FE
MSDSDDDFSLIDMYDSIEDPWLRSEFLAAHDLTPPAIASLRRRRDALLSGGAEDTAARDSPSSSRGRKSRRRAPRTDRRPGVNNTTRPPNRGQEPRRPRRPRPRVTIVIVIELD